MPELTSFEKNADMVNVLRALDRDGAVIIKNLISQDDMDTMQAELTPYFEATPTGKDEFHGTSTQRTGAQNCRE